MRCDWIGRMNILQCGCITDVSCFWPYGFGKTLILRPNTNPISITAELLGPSSIRLGLSSLYGGSWLGFTFHSVDFKFFLTGNQRHSKEANYILMSFIMKGDWTAVIQSGTTNVEPNAEQTLQLLGFWQLHRIFNVYLDLLPIRMKYLLQPWFNFRLLASIFGQIYGSSLQLQGL